MRPDQILALPRDQRVKLHLKHRIRRYHKQERTVLCREDMMTYLRDRGIRSSKVLEKKRMPTDPNTNDFRKEFGSWQKAVQITFGREIVPDTNAEYILKTVQELGLWTVDKYLAAHKLDPAVVPSVHTVLKEWGTFNNLFECARRQNLKYILEEYLKLGRKLGHVPSKEEARAANIRLDEVVRCCGGKEAMSLVISGLERQYPKGSG